MESGAPTTRPRHAIRQRSDRKFGSRQTDNQERMNFRYERDGPLSPLRSPLRDENGGDRFNRRRNYQRRRKLVEEVKEVPLTHDEFPPLTEADWMTPESNKWVSEGKKLDWSAEVDRAEARAADLAESNTEAHHPEKSRRKLDLRDKLTIKRNHARDSHTTEQKSLKPSVTEVETDEKLLARRQKDVDYGKNTVAYDQYISTVNRDKRVRNKHPVTPNKVQKTSRRSWDAQVRQWRRSLHQWDPPSKDSDNILSIAEDDDDCGNECSVEVTFSDTSRPNERLVEKISPCDVKQNPSDCTNSAVNSGTHSENAGIEDDFFSGFDLKECLLEDNVMDIK